MSYPRLALIGKDIAHSRSPEIYRRLISPNILYELIDIKDHANLPPIDLLASTYVGVNITAPWKINYFKYAVEEAKKWSAVNCIRFKNGIPEATNTDATALQEIIPLMKKRHGCNTWVILGDGSMAKVVALILTEMGESFSTHSRKLGDELNQLDLIEKYKTHPKKILVNTCAREFKFENKLDATWVFWDLNYAHKANKEAAQGQPWSYVDGSELLETQAQHAVKFWKL
jgi:shikimate dehydrogenase